MSTARRSATAALLISLLFSTTAWAQPLRWASDAGSGAPYVFHDPVGGAVVGYEAEIVAGIAARLHRPTVFVQNDWDGLIPGLQRGMYDIAIDGIEITPEHAAVVNFSVPYYETFEQLAVRRGDERLDSLAALQHRPIGTLKASVGDRILHAIPGEDVHLYDEEVNAYDDLANGRLDAVLLDYPIALYYGAPDARIALVGAPIGRLAYGIALARGNDVLRGQIDDALRDMQRDGSLRAILQKWNLWSPLMQAADVAPAAAVAAPSGYVHFVQETAPQHGWGARLRRYAGFLPLIARAAIMTLQVSVAAMLVAVALGLGLALVRLYAARPFAWAAMGVIEVVRGTPLLIQILFVFYGLPNIGIKLAPFVAGVLALGLNYAAYEAENYRAGLQAVPHGQSEAAIALNMTQTQLLRYVVVPQAFRIVVPVMTNDFISLLKDSSLVSVITLTELTQTYVRLSTTYYDYFGTGLMVGGAYLLLGLPFVRLSRWAERRLARGLPRERRAR
jgi:polar amino acid transport system substrate-binding protein